MELLQLDALPPATRYKVLRLVAGLSAKGLADRWGRSEAYVYRIEAGERTPTPLEAADVVLAALEAGAVLTHAEPPDHALTNGDSEHAERSATTSDRVGEVLAAAEASRESRRRLPKGSRRRQA